MNKRVRNLVIGIDVLCWTTLVLFVVHHYNCPLTF
jgi:hypothetical protein